MKKLIFFISNLSLAVCFSGILNAAVITTDCASSSNVQTTVDAATTVDGSTVKCASQGSYTWSGNVNLPATKNITFDGNGSYINGGFSIPSSANHQARITNSTFTKTNSITTQSGFGNLPWRLDHCLFKGGFGGDTMINIWSGPGLIDHCTFTNLQVAEETIHVNGWGAGVNSGWTNANAPGSSNAVYFEDNTATGLQGNSTCLFQAYYGARVVARYNTLNTIMLDVHGNTAYSGRWWEIYNNTFTGSGDTLCLRGGSGTIFGNTGSGAIAMVEEIAAGTDQVGYGQNFQPYPAYVWSNGSWGYGISQGGICAGAISGAVQLNRDVFNLTSSQGTTLPATCSVGQGFFKTDGGGNWDTIHGGANDGLLYKCTSANTWTAYYTPFTYPYPLDVSGMPNPSGISLPPPTQSPHPADTDPSGGDYKLSQDEVTKYGSCWRSAPDVPTGCTAGANVDYATRAGLLYIQNGDGVYHFDANQSSCPACWQPGSQ